MLCGNLALNDFSNVIAHNTALYDRPGHVRLAPQERQETDMPLRNGHPDYAHITNAAALSFDFTDDGDGDARAVALDDMSLENVCLIKVDTQGADLRVLQGAADTIRRCRPVILFEWERDLDLQHGTTLDAFFSFFAEMNYDVVMLHDTTPGRQGDYLAKPR
jgi:FkbM family methyltransferase